MSNSIPLSHINESALSTESLAPIDVYSTTGELVGTFGCPTAPVDVFPCTETNLDYSLPDEDFADDGTGLIFIPPVSAIDTYDSNGNLLSSFYEYDWDGDGTVDARYQSVNTYDSNGNLLTSLSEDDWDGDGTVDARYQSVNTYDSNGNLLTSLSEDDWDGDGTVDARYQSVNTYDSNGNLLTSLSESDWDGDGTVDARYQSVNTYDSNGNLLTSLSEDDWDGDGTVDARYQSVNTYDSNGNLLTSLSESDWDGDGTVDARYQSVNTYDSNGNLLTSLSEDDWDGDGTVNARYQSVNTYDSNGNLLTSLSEDDWDGDGTVNARYQSVNTYDSNGNLLTSLSESDWDGDGITDYRYIITNSYDGDGSLLSSLFEVDENGDGQIDYFSDLLYEIYPTDLAQDSVPRQDSSDFSDGNGTDLFVLFPCYISPDEKFLDGGIVDTNVDSSHLPEAVATDVDSSHLPEAVATDVDSSYLPETLDLSDTVADTPVEQEIWLSSSFSSLESDPLIRGVQVESYTLVGSDGDDILMGGRGGDRHRGGLDRDTFVFKKGDWRGRPGKILDFEVGTDVISLTKVFRGNQFDSDQPFEDYVRVKGSDRRTMVQIDLNGDKSGSDFKNLVVLKGVDFETIDADSFLV